MYDHSAWLGLGSNESSTTIVEEIRDLHQCSFRLEPNCSELLRM